MGAAYRIGPNDLFTPGDLQADADTLQSQVDALDAQVNGVAGLPSDAVTGWVIFQGDWGAFYAQSFGGFITNFVTALNDSSRDQLVQFENRFASLVDAFRAGGVSVVGTDVKPKTGQGGLFGNLFPPGFSLSGVEVVLGLIVAILVLSMFRKAT